MELVQKPTTIQLANSYLQGAGASLSEVTRAFTELEGVERQKTFGMLCIRKGECGERLIDLLFALAQRRHSAQPATFGLMVNAWQKHARTPGIEEVLRLAFCEHRFQ
jgi:hypothetical protein